MRSIPQRLLLANLFLCLALTAGAQKIQFDQPGTAELPLRSLATSKKRLAASLLASPTNCTEDMLAYALNKNLHPTNATKVMTMRYRTLGFVDGISQWFDAPQAITIKGVDLVLAATSVATTMTVSIHTPTNGLAPGTQLATRNITVAAGQADWHRATFTSPVIVNGPYVVVVRNPSNNPVQVYTNYFEATPGNLQSGRGEKLSRLHYYDIWYDASEAIDGFDADFIVEPVVEYTVAADFTASTTQAAVGEQVELKNSSSPIFQNRFYNAKKFWNHFKQTADDTFTWTLADGGTVNTVDATTTSTTGGSKTVTLKAAVGRWIDNGTCTNIATQQITFTATTLPVALGKFTALTQNDRVKLDWNTFSEPNNQFFSVLRSNDGANYTEIAREPSKGNGANTYSIYDQRPLNAINYYRLQQTDADGTISQLGDAVVKMSLQHVGIRTWPNPVEKVVKVSMPSSLYHTISLSDLQGRELQRRVLGKSQTEATLEVGSYPNGTYIITLEGSSGRYTVKIIK